MNSEVRIYNKVVSVYGTLTDMVYIQNNNKELSFFSCNNFSESKWNI